MNQYYTLFDPVDYNKQSIINLCDHYDQQKSWDDVYPGVKLKSKRRSRDFEQVLGVQQILNSFKPQLNITYDRCQLLCLDAGEKGVFHKDTDRSCGILFPLTPVGETFSHIEFYNEDKNLQHTVNYSERAIIINVLQYHNVQKTDVRRINFQVDFDIPYNQVVDMFKNGEIFR